MQMSPELKYKLEILKNEHQKAIDAINVLLNFYQIKDDIIEDKFHQEKPKEFTPIITPTNFIGVDEETSTQKSESTPLEVTPKPKKSEIEVQKKRKNLLDIFSEQNKALTSLEAEKLFCQKYGATYANENFARNSIMKLTSDGVLMRLKTSKPYQYGLKEWFKENGILKDEFKAI